MSATLGHVTAQLEQPIEPANADLIHLINENISPPTPVSRDDVFIRALYIVSDEINSYGGCFPADEHHQLARLLVDSPVLIGHRKDRLPIGRNFHATVVTRSGHSWVKSYFYWLKSAQGAANLKENIDGGIYKECSIAFTYGLPECSVCGRDIRVCPHEPSRPGADLPPCHFNYRQIERVLETSLVYRGAVPNTRITKELSDVKDPANPPATGNPYQELAIHYDSSSDRAYLLIHKKDLMLCLEVYQFNPMRFRRGVRFFAALCEAKSNLIESINRIPVILASRLVGVSRATNKRIVVDLDGSWASQLVVRRLLLDDQERFVLHCSGAEK